MLKQLKKYLLKQRRQINHEIIRHYQRVIKELLRDKRTLALMFLAPILILTLMYFIFNGDDEDIKLGVDRSVSSHITNNLPSKI